MIEYPLKPGTQQIYHTQKTNATRSHPNDTSWKAPAIAWIHASLQDTSQFSHWTPIKQKTPKKPLETTTYSHLNKFSLMFSPIWISCFCTNTNQKVGLPLVPNISKNGHCRTLSHFFSVFFTLISIAPKAAHRSKLKYVKVWSDWFTVAVSPIQTIHANCLHNMWWLTPMKRSCIIHNYLDPEVASEDLPSSASWNPYLKITLKVLKVSDQRPVIGICSAFFKHKQGWINADKGVKQPKATNLTPWSSKWPHVLPRYRQRSVMSDHLMCPWEPTTTGVIRCCVVIIMPPSRALVCENLWYLYMYIYGCAWKSKPMQNN